MGMKVLAPEPAVALNQRKTNREQKNYTRVTRRDMGCADGSDPLDGHQEQEYLGIYQ